MLAYLLSIAPSCKTLDQWLPDEALSMLQSSLQHSCIFVSILRVSISETFHSMNADIVIGKCHQVTFTSVIKNFR